MVSSEYLSEPCSVKGITIVGEAKTGDVDPGATVPSGPAGVVPNPSMGTAGAQIMASTPEDGEVETADEELVLEDPSKKILETVLTPAIATAGVDAPKRGTSRFKKAQATDGAAEDSLESSYLAQVQQLSNLDKNAGGTDGKWLVR
eukprot:scaffold1741_cov262-Pinguiococcus_pyrenoidosus.AAC.20